jgi:hypothetical protein
VIRALEQRHAAGHRQATNAVSTAAATPIVAAMSPYPPLNARLTLAFDAMVETRVSLRLR